MKRILPIILLMLATAGCKEEAKHCWDCNYTYSGLQPDKTGDTVLCNFTKTDIEIRSGKKFDATAMGYQTWEVGNCKQQ